MFLLSYYYTNKLFIFVRFCNFIYLNNWFNEVVFHVCVKVEVS